MQGRVLQAVQDVFGSVGYTVGFARLAVAGYKTHHIVSRRCGVFCARP